MKKKLTLSNNKMITGLCGGIANYFNIDPSLVRLLVVAIAILTAVLPALAIYLICSIFVPSSNDEYTDAEFNQNILTRSSTDKLLAGVCGGIAKRYNKDATIFRLLWVALTLLFGYGIMLYIAAAIIIPKEYTI